MVIVALFELYKRERSERTSDMFVDRVRPVRLSVKYVHRALDQ